VTVAILSRYRSLVNCRSRNVEGSFLHKVNYRYRCLCQAWKLHIYAKESNGLPSQGQEDG